MQTTRQQRFWDRVSGKPYNWTERLGAPYRHLALKALGLTGGETFLDLGCGRGPDFPVIRPAVGPAGRIVGVDISAKMLAGAQRRIAGNGWTNIELRQADITKDPLGIEEFDAAMAMCSISATPDIEATLDNLYTALKPGACCYITDFQPSGLLRTTYRLLAGAPGKDVATLVRERFDQVDILDQHAEKRDWPARTPSFVLLLARKTA
jgi:phosphatidylethanolamine/phosphatidyl-N-methylethanolamine N-methyltransferase